MWFIIRIIKSWVLFLGSVLSKVSSGSLLSVQHSIGLYNTVYLNIRFSLLILYDPFLRSFEFMSRYIRHVIWTCLEPVKPTCGYSSVIKIDEWMTPLCLSGTGWV